jgi:glycosyltransferase involved in cell wall biosynthesis
VVPDVTGVLVEPSDPRALAEAIVSLLKDADRRRSYGEAGRRRVTEHFGVDRLVDGTLQCYRRFGQG